MPTIRLAADADVPAIAEILRREVEEATNTFVVHALTADEWGERFRRSAAFYPWLVAVEGDSVLGFARASPFRDADAYAWTVEVSVYLRPDSQRSGLGRRLYGRLFALLHLQGFFRAIAVVASENPGSIAFHERVGMRKAGAIDRCGYKFDRFVGIVLLDLQLQDDFQKPGRILSVAEAAGEP